MDPTEYNSQQEVEAKALRMAQAVVDYDRKDDETRRAGDNMRRLQRLDLGTVICAAPDPVHVKQVLIERTPLTKVEVDDIHAVAEWTTASGYEPWLREISLSFTQNRSLAGIKVKSRKGRVLPSVEGRMAAVAHCIERNGGVFKEDKEFRDEMNILPPPNSLANIIERAKEDPEYKQELQAQGVYVMTEPEAKPIEGTERLNFWARRIIALRDITMSTRERAFEDPDTPWGVIDACVDGVENLAATRDLIMGRHQMEEEVV